VRKRPANFDPGARPAIAVMSRKKLQLLLVEDSPDYRTITLAYLQNTPYHVDIAENGAVACEKFKAGSYDLVLMDRQMPVMDGITAMRAIRDWEHANHRPPTPIIALTATTLKTDRDKCEAAGCTAYLTKPVNQAVLLQTIKQYSTGTSSVAEHVILLREKFADKIPLFLRHSRENVIAILGALVRRDFETVEFLGHGMRGAGGMFGFPAISDIGAELEQAALSADVETAHTWVGKLSSYLDQVEVRPN